MTQRMMEIADSLQALLLPEADPRQMSKRQRILQAATELFIAHGYRKTSVEEVARAAGIAKGTVYLYYRNKAELLFHAIGWEKLQYLDGLSPLVDPGLMPLDRLRALIALSIIFSYRMPLLARFTASDQELALALQDVDVRVLEAVNEQQVAFVARLIDEASSSDWAPAVLKKKAAVLMDLLFAVVSGGRMVHNDMAIAEYAHLVAEVIVEGIINEPRGWLTFDLDAALSGNPGGMAADQPKP